MKKPLSITSPNHAVALAAYFMLGFAGLIFVTTGSGAGRNIAAGHGDMVADIWATMLLISGLSAFVAAIFAKQSKRPEHNLRFEMISCVGIAINLGFYLYVLFDRSGASALGNASFTSTFFFGAVFRTFQILFELRLLQRARAHPIESDSVLADPREEHGQ